MDAEQLERRTGWALKPEGLCRGEVCIPLELDGDRLDVRVLAERLSMPLLHDEQHDVWALGPSSGGRALASTQLPPIELPDRDGKLLALDSLRGQKVLLITWASW